MRFDFVRDRPLVPVLFLERSQELAAGAQVRLSAFQRVEPSEHLVPPYIWPTTIKDLHNPGRSTCISDMTKSKTKDKPDSTQH